jgi:hypothetical protein
MLKEEENIQTGASLEIRSNQKYIEMRDVFEKLFRNKGYFGNKTFEKDVWFLQNDLQFQNMLRPSATPQGNESSKMHSLLRELSDSEDFKKLSVDTGKFIDRICEILYNSHQMVLRSRELIKEYNAHENVNVLEVKLRMLNEKLKEKMEAISTLELSVSRLDHLPEGEYQLNFHFIEMNPGDPSITSSRNRKLKQNKSLCIKQGGDIIVLNKSDIFNSFDLITMTALEANDKTKYLESFEYSGTTLSTFNLQLYKNDELFAESTPECFLDMFLNHIDKLREIEQTSITTNWKIKAKTNFQQSQINNLLPDYQTVIDFKFELDPVTRACIITRVLHILKDAIRTETQNEINKNEILDVYFKTISEQVKHILKKKEEDVSDNPCNCQGGCNIF